MGKTAFLYAGQGSQETGMGRRIYENYPEFRDVFDGVRLDFDLKEACFVNPDNILRETRYTQPCLVAFACGVTEILRNRGLVPDYVCGLSLGEYSALYAAGVLSLQDTMRIVSCRGNAMERASEGIDSAMTAIVGLDLADVEACCVKASQAGVVSVCNVNCPGQIVISGEKDAVTTAAREAKALGARKCVSLPVSGPFHTVFMETVADELRALFKTVSFKEAEVVVVYNVLGGPNRMADVISDLMVRQVKSPVMMEACLQYLFGEGVDTFIEIGPGKALQGFVKKTAKHLGIGQDCYRTLSINEPEDITEAVKQFSP